MRSGEDRRKNGDFGWASPWRFIIISNSVFVEWDGEISGTPVL